MASSPLLAQIDGGVSGAFLPLPPAVAQRQRAHARRVMTLAFVTLVAVAIGLACWVLWRAARLRREAESREARVLEALFVSRQTADGGATIDVDKLFGVAPAPTSADAVLRAVGVQAELIGLLNKPLSERPVAETSSAQAPIQRQGLPVDRPAAVSTAAAAAAATKNAADIPPEAPVPVRDLVQVFYEARGFRPASADASAQPIELVLAHKADPQRAYAFAPLAEAPSAVLLQTIIDRARRIGRKRVLIAVEGATTPDLDQELPAHHLRVFDRAAIDAQLSRLDAAIADRIRAAARRRAGQRLSAG